MAIVINPDGTVSTIEITQDRYGKIRPKFSSEYSETYNRETSGQGRNVVAKKSHKKKHSHNSYLTEKGSSTEGSANSTQTPSSTKTQKRKRISRPIPIKKQQLFISYEEIDMFFKDRVASGKWMGLNEYESIKNSLPENFKRYFASKYLDYLNWFKPKKQKKRTTFKKPKEESKMQNYLNKINELEAAMKRTTFSKPKVKKKKNKIPHFVKEVKAKYGSNLANAIGEIATFGTLKERFASSQDFDVRTSNPPKPARAPKYAYARDRYGRVQERDSFNEEKKNEFYNAQNQQKHYDYSSYDANDDNDGAYSDWD